MSELDLHQEVFRLSLHFIVSFVPKIEVFRFFAAIAVKRYEFLHENPLAPQLNRNFKRQF